MIGMELVIDAKELITLLEKANTCIMKKGLEELTRIYIETTPIGKLNVLGTDLVHWIQVSTGNIYEYIPGVLGIDAKDIKTIKKMKGELTLINDAVEQKLLIKNGKKTITIPSYYNTDLFLPPMDGTEETGLCVRENWLLETLNSLFPFLKMDGVNVCADSFHFNLKDRRVEALNGHCIGTRNIMQDNIKENNNILLHGRSFPCLKKIMNNKSEKLVSISQDMKYVKVKGKNFEYVTRKIDATYCNTNKFLPANSEYSFKLDKENAINVFKECASLRENSRIPVILHESQGKLYSYIKTERLECLDELTVEEMEIEKDYTIGFNPIYLSNIFNIVDSGKAMCRLSKNKAPMLVDGIEYHFLILPVIIDEDDIRNVQKCIGKTK